MKGLIGFEKSHAVSGAFRSLGHKFNSNDILDCDNKLDVFFHYKDDFFHIMSRVGMITSLDFLGTHPVCTYLANSGVRWLASKTIKPGFEWSDKYQIYINQDRFIKMERSALMFKNCYNLVKTIGKGYVENPIMHKYAMEIIGINPTQIIQPWMFGHTTTKATCLWVVGLPELKPTDIIPKELRTHEIHLCPPGPERQNIRSKTFHGIAKAMAEQWGGNIHTSPELLTTKQ